MAALRSYASGDRGESPVFGENQKRVMTVGEKAQFTPFNIFSVRARGPILGRIGEKTMLNKLSVGPRLLNFWRDLKNLPEVERSKKLSRFVGFFKAVFKFVNTLSFLFNMFNKLIEWFNELS